MIFHVQYSATVVTSIKNINQCYHYYMMNCIQSFLKIPNVVVLLLFIWGVVVGVGCSYVCISESVYWFKC